MVVAPERCDRCLHPVSYSQGAPLPALLLSSLSWEPFPLELSCGSCLTLLARLLSMTRISTGCFITTLEHVMESWPDTYRHLVAKEERISAFFTAVSLAPAVGCTPPFLRILLPTLLPVRCPSEHWVSAAGSLGIHLVLYLFSGAAAAEYLQSVLFKHCPLKGLWSRHLTLLEDVPWVCFQSLLAAPSLFCC